MLESFTADTFRPLIGQAFRVRLGPSDAMEFILLEASEHQPMLIAATASNSRRPFSILFRGPRDRFLPQRMVPFEHPSLGAFDLFIVPIGHDPEGFKYEAVFG